MIPPSYKNKIFSKFQKKFIQNQDNALTNYLSIKNDDENFHFKIESFVDSTLYLTIRCDKKKKIIYDFIDLPYEINEMIYSFIHDYLELKFKIVYPSNYPFEPPLWYLLDCNSTNECHKKNFSTFINYKINIYNKKYFYLKTEDKTLFYYYNCIYCNNKIKVKKKLLQHESTCYRCYSPLAFISCKFFSNLKVDNYSPAITMEGDILQFFVLIYPIFKIFNTIK